MAEDQLNAFLAAVEADAVLQEKINGVTSSEALLTIAKEAGYVFSAEDVNALKTEKELTDDEVADLSGGVYPGTRGPYSEMILAIDGFKDPSFFRTP
jgi:predicted ribosomally synthesized peptide with nif11-like leader